MNEVVNSALIAASTRAAEFQAKAEAQAAQILATAKWYESKMTELSGIMPVIVAAGVKLDLTVKEVGWADPRETLSRPADTRISVNVCFNNPGKKLKVYKAKGGKRSENLAEFSAQHLSTSIMAELLMAEKHGVTARANKFYFLEDEDGQPHSALVTITF